MDLPEFIAAHKDRLMECWKELARERLALRLESSELLNHLPDFIDDVVETLRGEHEQWPAIGSAQGHGRQRMRAGIDIGALTEELALITEAVCQIADEFQRPLDALEVRKLSRIIGRGTSASVSAYSAMRDAELQKQASEHFSFVAHELRTPLQTAQMAATVLRGASEAKRQKHHLRLERSLTRLAELVDESLVRVRLAGAPELTLQRWSAAELIGAACEDIEEQAEARELVLVQRSDDFEIEADRKLLVSALGNLLKNAVKFTALGGKIVIRAACRDSRATFEVEDECGGMPEDLPARLFQPFVQGHADRSGFGIGLMIVKRVAEAHQGTIRVTNHPARGCTFLMELPLRRPKDGEPET